MTSGAVPAQMLKGEKHFANTVPCNTGLSNQSHSSHFQIKTGHFCHLNFQFFSVVSVNFNRLVKFLSIIILEIVITRAAPAFHNLFMVMGCVFDINTVHKTVEKLRFQAFY